MLTAVAQHSCDVSAHYSRTERNSVQLNAHQPSFIAVETA